MFCAFKKILGIRTTSSAELFLFSGSAYFSKLVPKAFKEKWTAHGGEISSGTTLNARAWYFFATDPSEPWVTKLFAKSVVVIHAGWITHCIDEAFQVPIAEYILDDRFVFGPPYKLTNITSPIYVPLSEPGGPADTEFGESGPTPVRTSDTLSTPTSMRRKRKREQAYFDSPSGSLVFSGFDKDGMPRRPKKQRKLRFDPSFSPDGGRPDREDMQTTDLDWLWNHPDTWRHDGKSSEEPSRDRRAYILPGPTHTTTVRSPDTPDRAFTCEEPSATYRGLSLDEHLSKPTHLSSPTISTVEQKKTPPIGTIDFTNLPPPSRRWRFPRDDVTNAGEIGMKLSVVKCTDHKVKTPKKISFANHAQVCVYMVSPRRLDAKDGEGADTARQCLEGIFEDGSRVIGKTRMSSDEDKDSDNPTAEVIKELAPQIDAPKMNDDPTQLLGGDQFENDTLTLTMEQVQVMRHHILGAAAKNGSDDDQLAILFEPGKTFRGTAFRHVW